MRVTASVLQPRRQQRQPDAAQRSERDSGGSGCAPLAKLPAEGLQDNVRARQRHRKVVRVQHGEVAEELLHLADQLAHVHLGQVLQPQVLQAVGEDCARPAPPRSVSGRRASASSRL